MGTKTVTEPLSETFTVTGYRCLRCFHEWVQRPLTAERPRLCPRCKTVRWDTPLATTGMVAPTSGNGKKSKRTK